MDTEGGITVHSIVTFLTPARSVEGVDAEEIVSGPLALNATRPGGLTFCKLEGSEAVKAVRRSTAKVVLVHEAVLRSFPDGLHGKTLIGCESPRNSFIDLVDAFWPELLRDSEANDGATVHPTAKIGSNVILGPHVTVGANCELGNDVVVHGGACLYPETVLGARVRIDANAVIGSPGFGFEKQADGRWRRFPQLARVVLADDVEIGAGACIDRGALTDTIIGEGTKVDDLAYIAHNVKIGRHCLVMASSVIAGSCRLHDEVVVSPRAVVRDHCEIGAGAHVGLGAVVVQDVAPGTVVVGIPARYMRDGSYRG